MKRRLLIKGALALAAMLSFGAPNVLHAQENSGRTGGILTNKGVNWIEVKADGEKTPQKLIPRLIPARRPLPSGLDRAMLAQIQTLVVGNRVNLLWLMDDTLRVVQITQVPPRGRSGKVTGTVDESGRGWVDILPDDEDQPLERYYPQWVGDGEDGELDAEMLKKFATLNEGDHVTVEWTYDERKRATTLTKLAPPKDDPAKNE